MLFSTALGLFLGFWSLLYLADFYFRSRNFAQYVNFVEKTGIVVSPFQVRWYTSKLQPLLASWTFLQHPRIKGFLDLWFSAGVALSISIMLGMLVFLSQSLYNQLVPVRGLWSLVFYPTTMEPIGSRPGSLQTSSPVPQRSGLIPVVPGVNLPFEQIPVFLLVLVVAGVVHELGHAVAALNDNVGVNGFGVFLLAIYPGAFTEIENDSLDAVSLFRKMKIYCGGIWHNFVLSFFGIVILYALPSLLSFGFLHGKGVLITSVHSKSGISGPAGLQTGHVVYSINNCKVHTEEAWHACLAQVQKSNYGYCVPRKEVIAAKAYRVSNVQGELQCCSTNTSASHLCFYHRTVNDSTLINIFEYSCLPARYVTDHQLCNYSLPCSRRTNCVYPALFNSTKLLRFFIANQSKPVLFVGFTSEVQSLVTVSSYVPRAVVLPVFLPECIELVLKYLITFSLALALLNAVPCYSLDGQFIVAVLLEWCAVGHRKCRRRKDMAYCLVMMFGTFLLVANVVVALWKFAKGYVT